MKDWYTKTALLACRLFAIYKLYCIGTLCSVWAMEPHSLVLSLFSCVRQTQKQQTAYCPRSLCMMRTLVLRNRHIYCFKLCHFLSLWSQSFKCSFRLSCVESPEVVWDFFCPAFFFFISYCLSLLLCSLWNPISAT